MRRETGVGLAVSAGALLVVAVAGLITPGGNGANGALTPASADVPYDCRASDTPRLRSLGQHLHASGVAEASIAVLSPATCARLQRELARAATAVNIAPTLGDAERLGYKMVGFYLPGMGMHMERPDSIDAAFDPALPEYFLYGGNRPSAPIVGFAFSVIDKRGLPSMFAGGHDVPHSHAFCPSGTPARSNFIPGQGTCTQTNAVDGNTWLVHAWAVPGKPSPWGVFSDANPALTRNGYDGARPMSAKSLDCYYDTKAYTTPVKGCVVPKDA